uniref:Discoidin domain-containing protein n=1 Tax=Roseihalotalea indica TaxID=2867963 RepID=A0AA49GTK1_9BACT|nr:discoidin domain-containing protein [Tunicatimonas sp. TK19036]
MRKKIIDSSPENISSSDGWLDLSHLAQVELTSEDTAFPIDGALDLQGEGGWRASQVGPQYIRIIFDEPQSIRKIQLLFVEEQQARTQEFVLRYSSDGGHTYQDIVRQQYNFSPPQTIRELEEYTVNLDEVSTIELHITPGVDQSNIPASLAHLRIASK